MRERIKNFLAAQGMIKGHSGSISSQRAGSSSDPRGNEAAIPTAISSPPSAHAPSNIQTNVLLLSDRPSPVSQLRHGVHPRSPRYEENGGLAHGHGHSHVHGHGHGHNRGSVSPPERNMSISPTTSSMSGGFPNNTSYIRDGRSTAHLSAAQGAHGRVNYHLTGAAANASASVGNAIGGTNYFAPSPRRSPSPSSQVGPVDLLVHHDPYSSPTPRYALLDNHDDRDSPTANSISNMHDHDADNDALPSLSLPASLTRPISLPSARTLTLHFNGGGSDFSGSVSGSSPSPAHVDVMGVDIDYDDDDKPYPSYEYGHLFPTHAHAHGHTHAHAHAHVHTHGLAHAHGLAHHGLAHGLGMSVTPPYPLQTLAPDSPKPPRGALHPDVFVGGYAAPPPPTATTTPTTPTTNAGAGTATGTTTGGVGTGTGTGTGAGAGAGTHASAGQYPHSHAATSASSCKTGQYASM